MTKRLLTIIFLLTIKSAFSQSMYLNKGEKEPQDPKTLPKSKSKIVFPERKVKVASYSKLDKVSSNEWIVSSGWEMQEASKTISDEKSISTVGFDSKNWLNATVPGTVLTTLVEQGIYPDPFYGLNNLAISDSLCRKNWWYRTNLPIPISLKGKKIELLFNGINYRAEIWLNGNKIGRIDGAFIRGKFDITNSIYFDKENVLAVKICSPEHPGIPLESSPSAENGENGGILCYDGPTFIASEGWDWIPGIRDRNIGIWQDVRVLATNSIKIIDPLVVTDLPLPDTSSASLTIETQIVNTDKTSKSATISGKIESVVFSKKIILKANETIKITFDTSEFKQLNIKNPRLWWPNGYGKPELYKLKLAVINEDGDTSDIKTIRFGVRELSYDLSVHYSYKKRKNIRVEFNPIHALLKNRRPLFDNLPMKADIEAITLPRMRVQADTVLLSKGENNDCAPYLVIKVNGQRIFCKGGNWGMDDGMKRCSRERLEPYIRLHRNEHFTMLRNWTGESTEEALYDLCDEYGLLVWNEFWATTQYYNLDPWDNQLFLNNARDAVKRFRNHPSIAIWGARNEGFPAIVLEDSLRWMLAKEDPTRHYNPQSRYLNLKGSGPWNYYENQKEYFTDEAYGFSTEFGTVSVPTAETMRKFIPAEDLWPWKNDVWYYHDFNFGNWINVDGYTKAVENNYGGEINNIDDFCARAQLVNYDSYRNIFESYNSKLWNSTCGILLWMSHPAWPSTLWQTYSYDYETHGSYFGSKKACEPIHVQMNLHDNKVLVVNTSLRKISQAKITLQIFDINAKLLSNQDSNVDIAANCKMECFTPTLSKDLPETYLARLVLKDSKGSIISTNDYWRNSERGKDFKVFASLPKVRISGKLMSKSKDSQHLVFKVKNSDKSIAIGVKLNLRDSKTNESILPAYFSDGYFNLLPGEEKEITLNCPLNIKTTYISAEGYNISKQVIVK